MPYRFAVALAALSATACAANDAVPPLSPEAPVAPASLPLNDAPIPIERETIVLSNSVCFGTCPVYRVTVGPDGHGVFEGEAHVAVIGRREFSIRPEAYRAFARHVEPLRPQGSAVSYHTGVAACMPASTDAPTTVIKWTHATGAAEQSFTLYHGCRSDRAVQLREIVREAPSLLPIGNYVGKPDVGNR